jgi:hypothetical protein
VSTTVNRQGNIYVNNVHVGRVMSVMKAPRAVVDVPRPPARCIGWEYVVSPMTVAPTDPDNCHSDRLYRTRHEAVGALLERLS